MTEKRARPTRWGAALLGLAALVLAYDPLLWLIRSWTEPSYDSAGGFVFLAVTLLFLWSMSSPVVEDGRLRPGRERALALVLGSAAVRLLSRLLAVNVLGALTLVVDVYAVGLLSRIDRRRRSLSPFWLATAFAFSLPLERMVQRLVGFPLQGMSARGACSLLAAGLEGVRCEGLRIWLNGADVLVDLPCSGARGVLQLAFLFVCLAAVLRPRAKAALLGLATVLGAGLLANAVRISLLAIGIAYRDRLPGMANVMEEPWHGLIGLLCLALGASALLLWSRLPTPSSRAIDEVGGDEPTATGDDAMDAGPGLRPLAAAAFLLLSVGIVILPARPVDVSKPMPPPELPRYLDGEVGAAVPLSEREDLYFTLYGGGASRARYGSSTLMVVSTTSPLRHLHAPDECLTGAGHDVRFLGVERGAVPSAIYRSVAPDGTAYRVAVTYVSDRGELAESVAEVVWRWFQTPSSWSAVQRIAPWEELSSTHDRFDRAVARALELETQAIMKEERP